MDPKDEEKTNKLRAKVFKAVESLLEAGLSKERVEEAGSSLDVNSFSMVAEERSLTDVCGYPLCSAQIEHNRKWSRYAIRGKKVYDTSERRLFCSDECYTRYLHIRGQLPEEPLWFRGEGSSPAKLSFLENNNSKKAGLPGREVVLDDLTHDLDQLSLESTSSQSTSKVAGEEVIKRGEVVGDSATGVEVTDLRSDVPKDNGSSDDDDIRDLFSRHVDCESSSLGNWKPRTSVPKPASSNRPRRPILIDPLPLPPSTAKKVAFASSK